MCLHDDEQFTQITNMLPTWDCFISSCGKIPQCSSDHSSRKYESLHLQCPSSQSCRWGPSIFFLGDQINIPENGGAGCLLFAQYCLISKALSRRRIHPIRLSLVSYVLNELKHWMLWKIYSCIPINEFTHEIMVEFINLKSILIHPQICSSEGKCFTHPK